MERDPQVASHSEKNCDQNILAPNVPEKTEREAQGLYEFSHHVKKKHERYEKKSDQVARFSREMIQVFEETQFTNAGELNVKKHRETQRKRDAERRGWRFKERNDTDKIHAKNINEEGADKRSELTPMVAENTADKTIQPFYGRLKEVLNPARNQGAFAGGDETYRRDE